MTNRIFRAMSLWREKYAGTDRDEQFRLMSGTFLGASYDWGSENTFETDCSGLICGAFILMGYPIRINSEGLRRKVFTKPTSERYAKDKTKAVFFTKDGKAEHVGILIGPNVLYHSSDGEGAHYECLSEVVERYKKYDLAVEIRELSWEDLANNVGEVYDLDEELY